LTSPGETPKSSSAASPLTGSDWLTPNCQTSSAGGAETFTRPGSNFSKTWEPSKMDERWRFHLTVPSAEVPSPMMAQNHPYAPKTFNPWPDGKAEPIPTQWPNAKPKPIPTRWPNLKFLLTKRQTGTPAAKQAAGR
jgi:hypothetical protein